MTIIAAAVHPATDDDCARGSIAADTQSNAWVMGDAGSKLVDIAHNVVAGYAGSGLARRWLHRELPKLVEKLCEGCDDDVLTDIAFQEMLEDGWSAFCESIDRRGHGEMRDGTKCWPQEVLVVVPGCIYQLEADGSVSKMRERFTCIGCGTQVGMGALMVARELEMPTQQERLAAMTSFAVQAAVQLVPACGGEVEQKEVGEPWEFTRPEER